MKENETIIEESKQTYAPNPKAVRLAEECANVLAQGCINSLTEPKMTKQAIFFVLEQAFKKGEIS